MELLNFYSLKFSLAFSILRMCSLIKQKKASNFYFKSNLLPYRTWGGIFFLCETCPHWTYEEATVEEVTVTESQSSVSLQSLSLNHFFHHNSASPSICPSIFSTFAACPACWGASGTGVPKAQMCSQAATALSLLQNKLWAARSSSHRAAKFSEHNYKGEKKHSEGSNGGGG